MKLKFKLPFPCEGRRHTKKQAPAVRKLPGLRYLLKTDDNHHLYYSSYKKIHHEKKQKLSKEAQKMAELYTRLEILKSKQIEGVKTTRYTTDAIRACQGRIRKLLQKVGGIEEIQIKVDDAHLPSISAEYATSLNLRKTRKRQPGYSRPCRSSSTSASWSRRWPPIIIQKRRENGQTVNLF